MKAISSRRAKACAIKPSVKALIYSRDGGKCIFCDSTFGLTPAHVVPRSDGGLGIKENLVTACIECHRKMDSGTRAERDELLDRAKRHLCGFYPNLDEINVKYSKYDF